MENRVTTLEFQVKYHGKEIQDLKDGQEKLIKKLEGVIEAINAVKNWIIGGIIFAISSQVGLITAITKILF
jgi:hypothetical protein